MSSTPNPGKIWESKNPSQFEPLSRLFFLETKNTTQFNFLSEQIPGGSLIEDGIHLGHFVLSVQDFTLESGLVILILDGGVNWVRTAGLVCTRKYGAVVPKSRIGMECWSCPLISQGRADGLYRFKSSVYRFHVGSDFQRRSSGADPESQFKRAEKAVFDEQDGNFSESL